MSLYINYHMNYSYESLCKLSNELCIHDSVIITVDIIGYIIHIIICTIISTVIIYRNYNLLITKRQLILCDTTISQVMLQTIVGIILRIIIWIILQIISQIIVWIVVLIICTNYHNNYYINYCLNYVYKLSP
jgi:hypothetical protein